MVLGRRSFPSTMGDLCWTSSRWSPTWKVEVARYGSHGPGGNRSSNRNESIYSWGEEVKGLCVRSITYKARQKGSFFIFHMFFFWDFSWNFGFWFFWLANGVKWTARYTVVLFLLGLPQSIPPRNKCKKKLLYSETNGGELITISIQRCVSSGLTKLSDSFAATLSVKRWLAWEKRHGIHAFEKINRKNQPRLMFEEPSPNSPWLERCETQILCLCSSTFIRQNRAERISPLYWTRVLKRCLGGLGNGKPGQTKRGQVGINEWLGTGGHKSK